MALVEGETDFSGERNGTTDISGWSLCEDVVLGRESTTGCIELFF